MRAKPCSIAYAVSFADPATPSLRKRLLRCFCAVAWESPCSAAISASLSPRPISASIPCSRGEWILEIARATRCGALLRSFTWGLNVTGSLADSGGVGALVQITDHAGGGAVYLPARDANGNITALIDAGATAPGANPVAASYEYSPFGELLRVEGPYAASNPFRFSSKFTDDETGLVCYGLRYYNPALGRFLNRDPIWEAGGPNLYAFCGNNGVNRWDFLGLADPSVGMPEGGGSSGTWDNLINLGGFDSGWGSYGNSRGTSLVDGSKHDSQNKDFPSIRRWLESRVK